MKRHHQAYTNTHTHRFLLSMANNFSYLVSFCAQYTYNFLCVVWWADSFVRSCFVLLLHSTALITSNGSIHISMKKEKIGGVSRSINLPSLFFLVAFTCHDICLSPRASAHRFQMYSCHFFFSSSSFSYFAFVRTLLYFSSFIPVPCFFDIFADRHTHAHTLSKFHMLWRECLFLCFLFFVPSCTRTFPKNQT